MSEYERITDPATIRNIDWSDHYEPVTRILTPREMWIDVHADHARPAPKHGGNGNGEDCPVCCNENLPYPFLCTEAPARAPHNQETS